VSASDRIYDSRQLDEEQQRRQFVPGELRLHHLDGPSEIYILKKWCVSPGDPVEELQAVAIVETASFTLEIEAYDHGFISEHCFTEGQEIPDGAIIARIDLSKDR